MLTFLRTRSDRTAIAIAISLGLGLGACASERALGPDGGQFIGRLDGTFWSGEATAYLHTTTSGTETLFLGGHRTEEGVSIEVPIAGPGVYVLGSANVGLVRTLGGDAAVSRYRGASPIGGEIRILEYGGVNGVVRAELTLTFAHETGERPYGETAQLRNGQFVARVRSDPRP